MLGVMHGRSLRALHFSGTDNMEQAITWIMEHESDPDLDLPLLLPKVISQASLLLDAMQRTCDAFWEFANGEA